MNDVLSKMMDDCVPHFNDAVVNGIATESVKSAPDYIDAIIRSAMKSATEKLEYHGWRMLSPKEEYDTLFTTGNNRINYDIAVSDIYKIELLFSYNGAPLPKRYLYMPFLEDGGMMHISDTKYHIVPVLSDTVVSPDEKKVFIRLLRDKLIFTRTNRNVILNGNKIAGQVISSTIYRVSTRAIKDDLGSIVPPIALYLLAEYGFKDTFLKYAGIEPIITYDQDVSKYQETHDIYESIKLKPRSLKETHYIGHNVKVLVPKGKTTPYVENIIVGLIYTLDALPANANEMVDVINSGDIKNELVYWKLMLGKIIFKNNYSADRIYADIVDHFISLKSYIDNLIKTKLAEIGIMVNDFFDLLAVILGKYSEWLLNSKTYNNNIFNRYIDVLYYIMYDIILGINKTIFELTRKSLKKDLAINEVTRIFNANISSKKIFTLIKSSNQNITMLLTDYASDNKYHKITSVLELQERGKNVTKSKSQVFPKATRTITGPDLFMGSILYLPKKAPTPKLRINPFITLDMASGRLKPKEDIMESIMLLDKMFNGKIIENKEILNSEIEVEIDNLD